MKTKLAIALFVVITLFCSCKRTCKDIVKPSDIKPIDWNGWNDAYTVGYTFYDNAEDACFDFNGDTILCYGHIARFLYEDYPSLSTSDVYLESGSKEEGVHVFFDIFDSDVNILKQKLNNSVYSDTCFVKGTLHVGASYIMHCSIVYCPDIHVSRLEDIYFR